tara:strand:- start:6 stop:1544 length:1539 start_codon:yes stop_codon:yes gene_type:complete
MVTNMQQVERGTGQIQTAKSLNLKAAKSIMEMVKSTLGPAGMDKMMVDAGGNVIVTNDGATILQELDVAHPGAKMIIEAANTQEDMCYDGTTTTVVLAGQLLVNSEALFNKGIHPNIICRGYRQAARWSIEHLATLGQEAKGLLGKVAQTSVTGKSLESSIDHVSELCVEAVHNVSGDHDKIRVLCQPGGALEDSYCYLGVILHKEFMLSSTLSAQTHSAVLINTGMQEQKVDDNVSLQFQSAHEYQEFRNKTGKEEATRTANTLIELLPDGGAVFVKDGVSEIIASMLAKGNISVVQRVPESDMIALGSLLGVPLAHTPDDITIVANSSNISQDKIGDMKYVTIESDAKSVVTTLVLRGATRQTLDETERGFEDALGVVSMAYNTQMIVPGGGSTYIQMAHHLRQRAAEVGGREQMAIEAFAEALEIIPATIAENAGHDPLDTVLALRNEHQNGNTDFGPCVDSGSTISMGVIGVWEPLGLVRQAVQSASEVSIAILRIDDIVSRRGEAVE